MEGHHYVHTTALLCLPWVVPWVQVLLSWGPVPVLLDPSHLVHCDRTARIRRRPSGGGALQRADLQYIPSVIPQSG